LKEKKLLINGKQITKKHENENEGKNKRKRGAGRLHGKDEFWGQVGELTKESEEKKSSN